MALNVRQDSLGSNWKLKQDSRIGELKVPGIQDELALIRFDGTEGLSELFAYNIEALSEAEDINFDQALGSNCTVSIKTLDGSQRRFNGTLVEAQWIGKREHYFCYRMKLRCWLWLLSRAAKCRIFHNKTTPEVIEQVFSDHGFAKFKNNLSGSYEKREYCVQYRETDLNFVCRLMEEEGIYFYFEHSADEHTLILADGVSSHKPLPGGGSILYRTLAGKDRREAEHLNHWVPERRFNTGRVVLNDYDFKKPKKSLVSQSEATSSYENSKLEAYDYPGRYVERSVGDKFAKVRLEAEQATDGRCQATGNAVSLFPGALATLKEHPTASQNKEYLIVRASHSFAAETYRSGTWLDAEEIYNGHYEFLPKDKPFRAPQLTPKPLIHGPQTAEVVGEGEIDVDEYGRIKVQFHWVRDDDNEKESRRVRLGQVWSGKKWGGIFIPRVGMEVIVHFLEGDPDQPLVVGTVYNDDYMPPYDLPGKKNIAGWKSDSTEGGGGYNELVFDDTKGSELIRVHGQYDMDSTIEHDDRQKIGNDRTIEIGANLDESIGMSRTIDVGLNHTEKIGINMKVEAGLLLELAVGPSKIIMTPMSITISAPVINIIGQPLVNVTTNLMVPRLNGGTPVITV